MPKPTIHDFCRDGKDAEPRMGARGAQHQLPTYSFDPYVQPRKRVRGARVIFARLNSYL